MGCAVKAEDVNGDGVVDNKDLSAVMTAYNLEKSGKSFISNESLEKASKVKELRKISGLTVKQAAGIVHATENAWRFWEKGSRDMSDALIELFCLKMGLNPSLWLDLRSTPLVTEQEPEKPEGIEITKLILWPHNVVWAFDQNNTMCAVLKRKATSLSWVSDQTKFYHGSYPAWLEEVSKKDF